VRRAFRFVLFPVCAACWTSHAQWSDTQDAAAEADASEHSPPDSSEDERPDHPGDDGTSPDSRDDVAGEESGSETEDTDVADAPDHPAICGDAVLDSGEECDDGNALAGDGCEPDCRTSCHSDLECGVGANCLLDVCAPIPTGRICRRVASPEGSLCDDGLVCTTDDLCRAGTCVGDAVTCATCEICAELAEGCTADLDACWIDGTCHPAGVASPTESCAVCDPARTRTAWTRLRDFTPCTLITSPDRSYDICSSGVCVSPGCGDATCNPPGPHFPLPDTGQRICYPYPDVACPPASVWGSPCDPTTGGPLFCGQDAQYGWDITHAATERFARDLSVPVEPLVADEVTGLIWQGCAAGMSGESCTSGTVQLLDWPAAVAYCEELVWAGWDDWRLPDIHEMYTIVDYGGIDPEFDLTAFPGTPDSAVWSISACEARPGWSWVVADYPGTISEPRDGIELFATRCVRGGEPLGVDERFEVAEPVSGEAVVLDHATGLTWRRCALGLVGSACDSGEPLSVRWVDALAGCESLSWAGYTDWRLPDVKELASLADYRVAAPAADGAFFPRFSAVQLWTSSTRADRPDVARVVDLGREGGALTLPKGLYWGSALCVRIPVLPAPGAE
jgi:cysteine-rich repeat protein